MSKKKIGILGSGIVGQTLAVAFSKEDYEIKIGSRSPEKLEGFVKEHSHQFYSDTMQSVAEYGDILVLAVKGTKAKEALHSIGSKHLIGKTIIDATNPIAEEAPKDGVLNFFTEQNSSLMEELQKDFPEANFVKAFNSIGSAHMYQPDLGETPSMFICGNDQASKNEVSEILQLFGWEVDDMGTARASGAIESLCMLWCIRGFKDGEWDHAFKLIK